ncbi:MAG TPA: fatty acid desaturase [Acidimicrobiales bacterium]|nr:fatty acid desaturase [Acidimicrobiales bacterium]
MTLLSTMLVAAAVCQLATFCTTVYLHRTLSHRAITLAPGAALAFRGLVWLTTGIRPRQWVAVHRKHHAFSDEEGDPHSPIIEGFAMVQFGNVHLYRKALRDDAIERRYARDLPPDRWDRALFDRGWLGLGLGIVGLCVLLGPWYGLLAAGLHTMSYLLINAAINAIGHMWGSRPADNKATNNQWLALLTAGEGLHNNHHAVPTSARLALRRGEIDPAWWVVAALRRARLATVRLDHDTVQERLAS